MTSHKIESKRALSIVLVAIIALIILPIFDRLEFGIFNAIFLTLLSIGVFLLDSRKGNLNNSFLSSLVFIATTLTLDNAYSAIYFSMPLYKQIFGAVLVFMLFLFIPSIVRYVLRYFSKHPSALLITGRIIATIAAIGTATFIYLKSGFTLRLHETEINITQGWTFWSVFIIAWIVIHLYQIWRNKRDLTANHRFLYNTVALYLLSLIIYIGYIRDAITIQ